MGPRAFIFLFFLASSVACVVGSRAGTLATSEERSFEINEREPLCLIPLLIPP